MTVFLLFFSWLLRLMPHLMRMWLGKILGRALRIISKRRVHIARTNLELCFPDISNAERQAMLNEHIDAVGQGMVEGLMAWTFPIETLVKLVDIDGQTYLNHALELSNSEHRPILLLGMHTTSIDLTPPFLSTVMTASGVYKPLRNVKLDEFVRKGRLRHAEQMFTQSDMRGMLAHLQAGNHLWYASDQDFGLVAKGNYAKFFGHPAHTLTLYAKMAQRTNAIVLPVGVFRAGGRYVMRFAPILEPSDYATSEQAASTTNRVIEQLCDNFEPQYYWVHRRFKTQADGRDVYELHQS